MKTYKIKNIELILTQTETPLYDLNYVGTEFASYLGEQYKLSLLPKPEKKNDAFFDFAKTLW